MTTYLQTFDATATWATQPISTLQEIGNKVRFAADGYVDGLAWRRAVQGTGSRPQHLRLWDGPTQSILVDFPAPTDSGLVGWQWTYLASPVAVVSGRDYYVTTGWVNGDTRNQEVTHALSSAPAEYVIPASYNYYVNGSWGFPTTDNANGAVFPMDVEWSAGGTPVNPQPATPEDVDAKLADWLISTTDNTHQTDGLPWLTKTAVDAIQVVTDQLGHSGSGSSLDWVAGLWRLAGDLTDAEIGLLKSLLTRKDQITGASGGGGSAFYGPSGTQVAAGVETLLASGVTPTTLGAALALLREQLTLSPDLADTTRWTLVDTTSGDGEALVSQQADAYFFSITAYPASQAAHGVAATLWLPRWGWVCPRVHGHFAQRQFHDVLPSIITAEGHFMDGLLIYTPPGFEWTCESYVLDR